MADMKIPSGGGLPVARSPSGAKAEAIRAAQQAFFQAALGQSQAAPKTAAPTAAPSAAKIAEPQAAASAEPQRYLRPGSRLDIKV